MLRITHDEKKDKISGITPYGPGHFRMTDLESRNVSGHRLAFRRSGEGESVLLLHGIITNSFIWDNVASLLSPNFDVVAVDLIGCGGSDLSLDADFSITAQAELVAEFIDVLGIRPCHLVGHDIGGGIAQIIAVRNRNAIRSLALVNTIGYDFWPVQPIIAMRTPILRQLMMSTLDHGMLRLMVRRGLFHRDLLDDELMDRFWGQMGSPERRKAFLKLAHSLNKDHLLAVIDDLKRLDLPTLVLRGEHDIYLSPEISRLLHDDIAGSRFEATPTGGHFIQIDEPEWVADQLQRHMESTLE